MSDKILTEAFDKLKAIEESDDPFCIGELSENEEEVEEDALTESDEDSGWGDELLEALKLLLQEAQDGDTLREGVQDLIEQYDDPYGDKAHAEMGVEEALSPEMEKRKQADQAKIAQRKSFEEPRKRNRGNTRRGTGGYDRSMTQR